MTQNIESSQVFEPTLNYLEALIIDPQFSGFEEHVSQHVLESLGHYYKDSERWVDWITNQEILADRTEDLDDKVSLLLAVSDRQLTLNTPEVAVDTLRRLFLEAPERPDVYGQLEQISSEYGMLGIFAETVEDALEEQPHLDRAEDYLTKLASLYDGKETSEPKLESALVRLLEFEESEHSSLTRLVELKTREESWQLVSTGRIGSSNMQRTTPRLRCINVRLRHITDIWGIRSDNSRP